MGNSKEYNHRYWKANRLKLLKERAERYRKDKAYRNAILARSRAATAMQKLLRNLSEERDNGEENRDALNTVRGKERRRNSKEGEGKTLRSRASDNSRKHGNDSKYGKLPEPTVGR